MRVVIVVLLVVHGALQLLGFAKAFGFASLPQLTQSISREAGLSWLAAGALMFVTAAAMSAWPRIWWMIGAVALVVSQAAIASAWRDAWAGSIVNVVLLQSSMGG